MAAPVLVSSHTAYRGALTIAGDGGLVDLGFMLLAVGSSTPTSWSITLTSGTSGHWTTPTDGTFPTPTSTGDTADLNGGPYVFNVTATNADGTSNTCVLTISIRADTYSISSNADVSAARGTAGANNTTLCGKTLEVVRACTGFSTVGAGRLYLSRHNATATNSSRLTITNEDNEYPAEIECIQVENSNAVTINDTYTTATASAQAHHLHFNQNDFFTGETCGDIVVNRPVIRGPAGEVTNTKNGIYVHPACDGSFIFRDVDMTWVTNGIRSMKPWCCTMSSCPFRSGQKETLS
ncbi:hypothetical protein BSL82_00570 [Tardibacter chloracetimidivorans]|uniref:Uncharacterized protein n=1 Tax=Tardibacter chloracetimidivorans TaxID=1921510 RepID=A0A1L3ZQS9_9SPHN|nr:hypothetical protein [Tardibacter chloracetimidivorans]API57982.1 hypothetical protein BSL82_00570 [Tardibacter chloracetimidivorans]